MKWFIYGVEDKMRVLVARKNKDTEWLQICLSSSREEQDTAMIRYSNAGWELGWATISPFIYEKIDSEWNEIEDSQNNNLVGC